MPVKLGDEQSYQTTTSPLLSTAVSVAVGVVAPGASYSHAPGVRAPIYEPRRLKWPDHVGGLCVRVYFGRFYLIDVLQESHTRKTRRTCFACGGKPPDT